MEIKEIIQQLEYNTGTFPQQAVEAAIENRDLIIPELIKTLEDATLNAEDLLDSNGYFLHIYAMFLLAQFKEKKAYTLIFNFFSIPGKTPAYLTGDVVTEDLCRILASVCDRDTSLIKALIENPEIDEYVRSSALESLLCLVLWGEMPMEEFAGYLKSLFRGTISTEDYSYIWTGMVCCAVDIGATELQDDIKKAFENELIETFTIGFEEANKGLLENKEKKLDRLKKGRHYSPIEDTVKELCCWASFTENERHTQQKISEERIVNNNGETLLRTERKIGRNEPCPCGSGKKYKKCCLQ